MHIYIKKISSLFFFSMFFIGQVAASSLETSVPSIPEKLWYKNHEKKLIAGGILVALVTLDNLTSYPVYLNNAMVKQEDSRLYIRVNSETFYHTKQYLTSSYCDAFENDIGVVYRRSMNGWGTTSALEVGKKYCVSLMKQPWLWTRLISLISKKVGGKK